MRTRRGGQTATEYMLIISVIVCSVVAAAYLFVPEFQGGVAQLAQDVSVALATGQVGGIGFLRHGQGGGGGGLTPGTGGSASGNPTTPANSTRAATSGGSTSGNSVASAAGPTLGRGNGFSPSTAAPVFNVGSTTGPSLGLPPPPPEQTSVNNGSSPVVASHVMQQAPPVKRTGSGS